MASGSSWTVRWPRLQPWPPLTACWAAEAPRNAPDSSVPRGWAVTVGLGTDSPGMVGRERPETDDLDEAVVVDGEET